jgi:Putative porin
MFKTSRQIAWLTGLTGLLVVSAASRGWCADAPDSHDPLLDLFIKKGFVTQQEAEKVKAEADYNRTNGLAGSMPMPSKWKISDGVKSVELFGDVRLRYESRSAEDPSGGHIDLDRLRYSVRLGLRGDAFDDFYYGLRIETSSNPRSSWGTFGSSSTGPFGKSTAGINIGQAYLGWRPEEWVDFTLGKMPNPLYTTPMVWSPSLNPEGASERFKYTIGEADFFANFGQFIYQDTNPTHTANGYFDPFTVNSTGLPFLLAWQAGVNYHLAKKVTLKVAPALYQYTSFNNGQTLPANGTKYSPAFAGTFVGQGQVFGVNATHASYNLAGVTPGFDGFYANQTGINDLLVLELPVELNIKLEKFNLRFFGDYAHNLHGADRANAAYAAAHSDYFTASTGGGQQAISQIPSSQIHDVNAYQIGFGIGSTNLVYGPTQGLIYGNSSKKGAWELRTYWQHIEQYALDPNLIDSDAFEGRENMEGVFAAFAYGFSDNIIGTVRYGNASRINNKLGTGGSNPDIPQMNPINNYNFLQVDLGFRF